MGVTYAKGSIIGQSGIREYDFLVDTGSTWLGLPQANITALGLIPGEMAEIETPTSIIRRNSYQATGMLEGLAFEARVVPANRPIVGYELLQELGFVVDLVSERIALRTEWEHNL